MAEYFKCASLNWLVIEYRDETLEGAAYQNDAFFKVSYDNAVFLKMQHSDWLRLVESDP